MNKKCMRDLQNIVADIDVVLRLYVPDLEKFKIWTPPKAVELK